MTNDKPILRRVADGAVWLDNNYPGWRERVDVDTLDMPNVDACVLAQSSGGDFFSAMNAHLLDRQATVLLGFDLTMDEWIDDVSPYALHDAWVEEITRES